MFNLDQAIKEWRAEMFAAGIKSPEPLDELESHLRDEIAQQIQSRLGEQQAFEIGVQQIGQPEPIIMEFKENDGENWNRPFALIAWILFVISFFLPSYADGFGWQCALLSLNSWRETPFGSFFYFHLALLTLANLLVIASPFLLLSFSLRSRCLSWLRWSSLAALFLVWSFVVRFSASGGWKDLKIGCYVWSLSFLFLSLSVVKIRIPKTRVAATDS
jgi:hypothetical protein